ncbi:HpcH/HpaI aldolase/citrate lyase family protein [Roseixanthobacter pseudopolyaromaticivorans]|uniref:HpcH/HpaI aldolase/citrate lyase family protein n=1 Tax=Xanthobacteraceae TaxID=335928 RepID=UPI0037288E98
MSSSLFDARLVVLFVPGDRPERFGKALAAGADAIILDLEDAVAVAEKPRARDAIAAGFPSGGGPIFLRVNPVGTPWHAEDLALARRLPLAGLVLPKAESVADIPDLGDVPVMALVESARGIANARAIAAAPQVRRLAFGSIDFAADIGSSHTNDALLAARSELVLASRLAGLAGPLDGVTAGFDDAALCERDAAYAASLGCAGKLCIHPRQIAPVIKGFAPSEAELAWATRVLAASSAGGAAVKVDGAMVDTPVRLRAEGILARAQGTPTLQGDSK